MTVVERTQVGEFTWDDIAAAPPDGTEQFTTSHRGEVSFAPAELLGRVSEAEVEA